MVSGQLLVSRVPTKDEEYSVNWRNNIVAVITRARDTMMIKKGNSEKIKRKSFTPAFPKHYKHCSVPIFLILFKKLLASSPFKKDYAFYMRDYKGEITKLLPFYMTLYFISILPFYLLNCKVLTFEEN